MTTSGPYLSFSQFVPVTSTLASSQYKIVQAASTAGTIKVGTSATSLIIGVLLNEPAVGEPAEIAFSGVVKVLTEASVTAGGRVCCSSTGRAKLSTGVGDRLLGIALDAAGAAGDLIRVMVSLGVNGTA